MNFVLLITNRSMERTAAAVYRHLEAPMVLTMLGRGTATREMLDLWGLEAQEKTVMASVASDERTRELMQQLRKKLYLDIPGNGIIIAIPIKSVGGARTLAYLANGSEEERKPPQMDFKYELITAVANEGCSDMVMEVARKAGATGGTVIHAKGGGSRGSEKFFKLSIANEKDMILIVAQTEKKGDIMRSIIREAGPKTRADCMVFSQPVSEMLGIGNTEDEEA